MSYAATTGYKKSKALHVMTVAIVVSITAAVVVAVVVVVVTDTVVKA